MWVIQYFDWQGTMEELEKFDKIIEKECEKIEGVKYKGRYGPHNKKYHWAYFYKIESYDKWMTMGSDIPRDYSKASHIVVDLFE
jgi:hypothetical protein